MCIHNQSVPHGKMFVSEMTSQSTMVMTTSLNPPGGAAHTSTKKFAVLKTSSRKSTRCSKKEARDHLEDTDEQL